MNDYLFVIVLYKNLLEQSLTYKTLISFCPDYCLFVYDNSPNEQIINRNNTIYVHDEHNSGLSVAYNKACKFAKDNGYKWLLLLDQDTDFSGISIKHYENAIKENPDIKLFAPQIRVTNSKYASPNLIKHKTGKMRNNVPNGIISLSNYGIINSGMCINVDAMIECGGYNEKVFLDYSDFEFLERFKKKYPIAFIINQEITQNLSVVSDNKETTINRYRLFCRSLKHCERHNFGDNLWFFVLVFKRGLSICLRKRTFKPIKIFMSDYL